MATGQPMTRIEIDVLLPRAWQTTRLRQARRQPLETSLWATPEEIGTYGACAEAVYLAFRGLPAWRAFNLTRAAQTHEPDVTENPSAEVKTTVWIHRSAFCAEHVWVSVGAKAELLVVYRAFRCPSWPRERAIRFAEGHAAALMDRCAQGGCGHRHHIAPVGWLDMSRLGAFPRDSGKGGRGESYRIPTASLEPGCPEAGAVLW